MKINDPARRFLFLFLAVLVAAFALIAWNPVNDGLIVPLTEWITRASATTLGWIGHPVTVQGTVMGTPAFLVDVKNGCNGVEAMLILLAAVVAFPAPLVRKLKGLFLGTVIVQAVNLVRIDSLYLLGLYHQEVFELFHGAIWQVAIVLIAIGFFLVWSSRVAEDDPLSAD